MVPLDGGLGDLPDPVLIAVCSEDDLGYSCLGQSGVCDTEAMDFFFFVTVLT